MFKITCGRCGTESEIFPSYRYDEDIIYIGTGIDENICFMCETCGSELTINTFGSGEYIKGSLEEADNE